MVDCETSFNQLKHLLTNESMLKITYSEKDFVVCTDSSKEGLVGVLMLNAK